MSFNADLQVLTQPGATGQQTYSLAASFDPQAVILWAVPGVTTDTAVVGYSLGIGFGTYRGSTVQQRFSCIKGLDAVGSADTGRAGGDDSLLALMTHGAGATTKDLEIDLVSMQGGGTSQVVLDWVNLHTTASIKVLMLVLGGSDITDALVDEFNAPSGTSANIDETVVSGFGKPDLLFFTGFANNANAVLASHAQICFGFGKQGEAGRSVSFGQLDGDTAALTAIRQRADRVAGQIAGSTIAGASASMESDFALDTVAANWPTDGFRIVPQANPSFSDDMYYLALRTTAQIATGQDDAPTAGGLPVAQDTDVGFPPKCAVLFGWNLPASTAVETSQADQASFGIGAYDGATEGHAAIVEDDAAVTMLSRSINSSTKIVRNYVPPAVIQSAADGVFTGNLFRRSWTDIDTVAREHYWIVIGDGFSANPLAGTVASASSVTGDLTASAPLTGAAASASTVTGSSTVRAELAGTVAGVSVVAGALTVTAAGDNPLAGTVAATSSVTGALLVRGQLAGTAAAASTVAGALTARAGLLSAVAGASGVTGSLTVRHPLTGAVAGVSTVAGTVILHRPLAGTVQGVSVVIGTLTNEGLITPVGRLEAGLSVTALAESTTAAAGSESSSGVLALIE